MGKIVWWPEIGIFCAVGGGSGGNAEVFTSSDGKMWDSHIISNTPLILNDLCWSPKLHMFLATNMQLGSAYSYSTDGTNWTQSVTSGYMNNTEGCCWSPDLGIFCVTGYGSHVFLSGDGINWTSYSTNGQLCGVEWSSELGLFCSVNISYPYIQTSTDGINWTARSCHAGQYQYIKWCDGINLFIACGSNAGTDSIAISNDGITWSTFGCSI